MDFWYDFLILYIHRSKIKIKKVMLNVLKAFLCIVVSCFGIGFSMNFLGVFSLVFTTIFIIADLVGILFVWRYSKLDLWGVFYTFVPSLVVVSMIYGDGYLMAADTKIVLLSLEYSFVLVLVWLLVYSLFLGLKKVYLRN